MKIKNIEFENFRNFKDRNKIIFDTDGKVTVIYGKNGDGKTTLHQLFQWVFYNDVRFNKTASDKMYNHEFEKESQYNENFSVWGCIDFEHEEEMYSLKREWIYQKGLENSKKIQENLSLNKQNKTDTDVNWDRLDNPTAIIEELLPAGLSEYFFFDGESMIADLSVKGKVSANKLKNALYSMFDLNLLKNAVNHIGKPELKTTVLGQLYLSKANTQSGNDINVVKTNIENAQGKITLLDKRKSDLESEHKKNLDFIQTVSEKIGSTKSNEEYENKRKHLKKQRNIFLDNTTTAYSSFGDEIIATFPKMLLSKTIEDAKEVIKLKVDETRLVPGVTKKLIDALLKESTCVCGRPITQNERKSLTECLSILPPLSYKTTYDDFNREAKKWGKEYSRESIENYIRQVLNNKEQALTCDLEIHNLDEEEKESQDIQSLVIDRQKAENNIEDLSNRIIEFEKDISKYNIYLRKKMKEFDELTSKSEQYQDISNKLDIMLKVKEYYDQELKDASVSISEKLKYEIQLLLEKMLTSTRYVSVSPEFYVRVFDSYDDEAKSEGQFAVVSFAYIGGILKLLKDEYVLSSKEYPLVLDGPFSKLDNEQRQNVINTIPEYAPQIILFSKDDLQEFFDESVLGRVWTISSNDEKNVAKVEEGFLW
jgi:DNA sulfur modification protein DndD